ncbi:MAG: hypothetical protein EZS26_003158 [Candidatus Ordinivivax streblomastigis]|uniref:Secretion system C-terminal sorting domain-containing protein n=1 Tax=Candidatus Ordinivivax streblomastigis TaxID=2540710 RepID=A0A5M8NXV8_9BACT|nr:MAG: hypothetical protein EZS26_003158 [Candidatus Ordinivivax streblomastigis]
MAGGGITFDLNISAYNKISVAGTVQIELQDGEARAYLTTDYTPNGGWQTLVFDLPNDWTHLSALLVAPHLVNTSENPLPTNDNENHRISWDNVRVYSNTETALLNILVSENAEIVSTQIYSITGSLVTSFDKNESWKNLPHGIYILQQTDAWGNKTNKKVVY